MVSTWKVLRPGFLLEAFTFDDSSFTNLRVEVAAADGRIKSSTRGLLKRVLGAIALSSYSLLPFKAIVGRRRIIEPSRVLHGDSVAGLGLVDAVAVLQDLLFNAHDVGSCVKCVGIQAELRGARRGSREVNLGVL